MQSGLDDPERLLWCLRIEGKSSQVSMHYSLRISMQTHHSILERLGVAEHDSILQYLGVPISRYRLRGIKVEGVEHTIREWLEGWQARNLSMMGKIILIRSVLNFMPV